IASDIKGIYEQVATDIEKNNYVVFSGTPCQVAALKKYLESKKIESGSYLLTMEVICHGVGDNAFFKDYIQNLEKKYKSKAVSCSFRAKSKPGKKEDMQVEFANGKKYNASTTKYDWFFSAYLKNYILKQGCFTCPYATVDRNADITISDMWGKGSDELVAKSLVFTNSEYGESILRECDDDIHIQELSMDEIYQPHMFHPSNKPDDYEIFMDVYKNKGYYAAQKYIGNNTLKGKIRSACLEVANKLNIISMAKIIKNKMR
ncbi:MAG: Coenzyme F420 hydrogenase/dehydrogenase, beta subunit C-terminal domain, partial [Lachnospiraceae bacterium]|nr:Coenzyme F420 hydrogenase/dehydrogenase, beta subunit C-terminal domain [Lachnospiraceae bacterium]